MFTNLEGIPVRVGKMMYEAESDGMEEFVSKLEEVKKVYCHFDCEFKGGFIKRQ